MEEAKKYLEKECLFGITDYDREIEMDQSRLLAIVQGLLNLSSPTNKERNAKSAEEYEEVNNKVNEAKRLMQILLPEDEFGENEDAGALWDILESFASSNKELQSNVPTEEEIYEKYPIVVIDGIVTEDSLANKRRREGALWLLSRLYKEGDKYYPSNPIGAEEHFKDNEFKGDIPEETPKESEEEMEKIGSGMINQFINSIKGANELWNNTEASDRDIIKQVVGKRALNLVKSYNRT